MHYIKRNIRKSLQEYIQSFCVVGITGPRQAGKTTMLHNELPDYRYVTMDDFRNLEFFDNDPEGFMQQYDNKVIFDEVHYAPKLFNYIKIAVDNDRQNYGKYILSSSNQFTYQHKITESLAGRIGLLSLLPLQINELPYPYNDDVIIRGGYPELIANPILNRNNWYSSYIETYLEKDVKQLANIGNLSSFRKFIQLLAANTAQILDMQNFAKQIGVSGPTIKFWLSVLEASYVIYQLPPYFKNYGKRISKRPKIYFYDLGLVSFLTGIETTSHYKNGPMAGAIFENYVISEILKREKHNNSHSQLYYLRDSNKKEIDLIIDRKNNKDLIEIKKTSTFVHKDIKTIKKSLEKNDQAYLLYNGKSMPYSDDIKIMNFVEYCN